MDADQKPLKLRLGKPFVSSAATLLLDTRMQPGQYRLQLVVTDEAGCVSQACMHDFSVDLPRSVSKKILYFILRLLHRW